MSQIMFLEVVSVVLVCFGLFGLFGFLNIQGPKQLL